MGKVTTYSLQEWQSNIGEEVLNSMQLRDLFVKMAADTSLRSPELRDFYRCHVPRDKWILGYPTTSQTMWLNHIDVLGKAVQLVAIAAGEGNAEHLASAFDYMDIARSRIALQSEQDAWFEYYWGDRLPKTPQPVALAPQGAKKPPRSVQLPVTSLAPSRYYAVQAPTLPVWEPLLSASEAGELLKVHEKTIIRLARANKLPGFQLGERWRFKLSTLAKWVDDQIKLGGQPLGRMEN